MKPVKANNEIIMSDEWCRIDYTTRSGHGYMILKEKLLFDNFKKFQKVLKGTDYKITEYYKITMKDIIISAIDKIKDRIQYYQRNLKHALDRPYRNDDDIQYFYDELVRNELILQRLEYKICPSKNYTID